MAGFADNMRVRPPCIICGSSKMEKNDLQVDWIKGSWKGEWTCKNGHTNVFK